jgi:hypothetical protein
MDSQPFGIDGIPTLLGLLAGLRQSSPQHFGEYDDVVVLRVTCGIDQGERAFAGPPPELPQPGASGAKLLDIAAAELLEPTRVVREPRPEFGAWRQFLLPLIQFGPVPGDPTWPETVDQDAVAVRGRRGLVRTFQTYVHPGALLLQPVIGRTARSPLRNAAFGTLEGEVTQGGHHLLREREGMAARGEGRQGGAVPVHYQDHR